MKPIGTPAHEAKESPAMERKEHQTGMEMQDVHGRGKRKGSRKADRHKRGSKRSR